MKPPKKQVTLLAAALHYAKRGYGVFPCMRGTKKPAGRLVEHGLRDATTDSAQIATWWRPGATLSIGLVPPAGCFVVDVDTYKAGVAEAVAPLLARLLALRTPRQRSGGGGLHFVLRGPVADQTELRAAWGVSEGIDIKAHGKGYVIAAPSVHPDTGAFYEWEVPPKTPIADAPNLYPDGYRAAPVRDVSAAPSKKPRAGMSIAEIDKMVGFIPADHFDPYDRWVALIAAIHHETEGSEEGLELAERLSRPGKYTATDKWSTFGNYNGDEARMHGFIGIAKKYGYKPPRSVEAAVAEFDAVKPAKVAKFRADTLLHKDTGEVKVLIPGLLTAGLSLISGQPKVGKSWLVLKLLLDFDKGSSIWGRRIQSTRALYLALEDNERRMKSRLKKLGALTPRFDILLEAPRVGNGLVEYLRDQIMTYGYEIVVIDTLAKIRPLQTKSTNAWQTDYENVQKVKALADELNVAILVITHNSKAGSNGFAAQNAIASTGGLMAGVDGWWVIEHTGKLTGEGEAMVKLTVEHRDVEGGEFALVFDKEHATWEMLGGWNEMALGELQRHIVEALQRSGKKGMPLKALADATGHKTNSVSNCLIRLRKRGRVVTDEASINRLAG